MGFSWIKASVSHVAKFAEDKLVPLHKVCNALFKKPALPHILYFPVSSNKKSFFSVLFLTTDNQIGIFFSFHCKSACNAKLCSQTPQICQDFKNILLVACCPDKQFIK